MSTAFQSPTAGARDRRVLAVVLGVPAIVAWALLTWWGASPAGERFMHADSDGRAGSLPLVLVGWVVMTAAMMLPTTAPLMRVFLTVTRERTDRGMLVLLVVFGYGAVWTLVGGIAIVADEVLHALAARVDAIDDHPRLVSGGIFLVAGAYQFTSLKRRCLDACRSPFVFVSHRWRGVHDRWNAFALGADHGWYCVGCCWSIMLLMFAVGMANVGWMFVMGVVMAVEKNIAKASWLGPLLGVALLGIGAVLLTIA